MTTVSTISIHKPDEALLQGLVHLDNQLGHILGALSDENYVAVKNGRSSIGSHARHIIEFMQAITHGPDLVNYDARKRNLEIEASRGFAKNALNDVIAAIADRLARDGAGASVHMVEQLSNGNASVPIPSTLGREIAYAIQHGIHHIFIIKAHADLLGVALDDEIGVAPATVTYQNQ